MNEIWKDIKGYEGYYQISNLGRVKGLLRIVDHSLTKKYIVKSIIRKNDLLNSGYVIINLAKNGIVRKFIIHRLVAQSFIQNPEKKSEINHKNGIKKDNRVENLEWCTRSENCKHSFDIGLSKRGEDHYKTKLTEKQVIKIKRNKNNLTVTEMAKKYHVTYECIRKIIKNYNWKHIIA